MARIGLVSGEGKLPIVFARAAKDKGDTVIAFGVKGLTDEAVGDAADKMHWLQWGDLKKAMMLIVTERISKIVLLGKIRKDLLFNQTKKLDAAASDILKKIDDKKDYAILNEVAGALKKFGIDVIDPTVYLKEFIPTEGVLTKRKPTEGERQDIEYGKAVARQLSGLDIGQTVAIKDKTVIAAEAVEGTDEAIKRAGTFAKNGFVVVKVARPDQDMRFDIPLVGLTTIATALDAGASAFALEAGKTLLMDRDEIIRLADEKNVSIVII